MGEGAGEYGGRLPGGLFPAFVTVFLGKCRQCLVGLPAHEMPARARLLLVDPSLELGAVVTEVSRGSSAEGAPVDTDEDVGEQFGTVASRTWVA